MLNSKVVKAAHKMTKEIKREYPEVNYKLQYGLCLSYLLNKEEQNMLSERAVELQNSLNITEEEAKELEIVEQKYQSEYKEDSKVTFKLWESYGKKRVYITCPWRSKNQNSFKNYYDLNEHYLFDRYIKL